MNLNEISTRDIFFSNPVDRFLGQENIKTSHESGFSSSYSGYNQTGNSLDLQYKSSQDLFTQSERVDSPFQVCNSDYQKYISQNLLIGKGDKSPKRIFSFKDSDKEMKKEKKLLSAQNENQEIKKSLDILNDNVVKLNSEIVHQNNKVNYLYEEVSKLNEKMTSIENSIGKGLELINERYKTAIHLIKNEEGDKKMFFNTMSETSENIRNLTSKIEDYKKRSDKEIEENIKKVSKNQETANKKQLQTIQNLLSKLQKTVDKTDTIVVTTVKDIQKSFEKTLELNFNNLKNYIHNSKQQLVASPDGYGTKPSMQETNILKSSLCDMKNNVYSSTSYKNSTAERNCKANFNFPYNGKKMWNISDTFQQNPAIQTPLAYYVDNHEKRNRKIVQKKYATRSKAKLEQISESKERSCYSSLNIKRRILTPLAKTISPLEEKLMSRPKNPYCEQVIGSRHNIFNPNRFQRNPIDFSQAKYGINLKDMQSSMNSSPGLTVYQATTLAREYATHAR